MNFTKMQGVGNDFVLIEADYEKNWPRVAIAMCDRHFGVGGDGLLVVLPSNKADLRMREFNPDGSEAEACGNGLRCVAKYAAHRGLVNAKTSQILVETISGIREAKLERQGGQVTQIQVSLGKPVFEAKNIPVLLDSNQENVVDIKYPLNYSMTTNGQKLLLHFVSMGNPHAVCFWQQPVSEFPLPQLGPIIERHRIFPNRTNFEIVNVIDQQQMEARVWERGVGETLACGSGACAIAVVAKLQGYTGQKVVIKLPGGVLNVKWNGKGEVLLSGPAEIVFKGEWLSEV